MHFPYEDLLQASSITIHCIMEGTHHHSVNMSLLHDFRRDCDRSRALFPSRPDAVTFRRSVGTVEQKH